MGMVGLFRFWHVNRPPFGRRSALDAGFVGFFPEFPDARFIAGVQFAGGVREVGVQHFERVVTHSGIFSASYELAMIISAGSNRRCAVEVLQYALCG